MTHNTPAPVADKTLAERLLPCPFCDCQLIARHAGWFDHPKGKCILSGKAFPKGFIGQWNNRSGQLITMAEAQEMVAAERDRCAAFCEGNSVGHTTRGYVIDKWEYEVNGGTHCGQAYAAAIRAAATRTKEGD